MSERVLAAMSERVLAAMSGGVDSSVAAYLLLERGFAVAGATLRLHDGPAMEDAVRDAAAVADALGIAHHAFDCRVPFRERVEASFARCWLSDLTPNPCVLCNRVLKFPELLRAADALGCARIATGHYARVEFDGPSGRWLLKKGADDRKDQGYFLFRLTQEQLSRTVFPLGSLTKEEVRRLAEARELPTAHRTDSQDVCFFLPGEDVSGFLTRFTGEEPAPGDFVDEEGRTLGRHRGRVTCTVGQRRGLGVASTERLFVLRKERETNRVVLGPESRLLTRLVRVKDAAPGALPCLESDFTAAVKLRYSRGEHRCRVHPEGPGRLLLEFSEPVRRPAAGQSAVLYEGDVVLGGGEITDEAPC